MSDGGKSIVEGLKAALAYARGDKSQGKAHRVRVPDTDVARARRRLGISQARFAAAFGINVGTLRNWEQGIREPEGPARVLLLVIERHPDAVLDALKPKRKRA